MSDAEPPKTLPAFTPVPREKDRSNGWKPHVQRAFIEALADTGSVATACRMVGRSTHGAYHLRRQPGAEEFAAAWEAAIDLGVRRIEDVAMDRALNGVEVPVYSYGQLVGTRVSYNDRLLMFMLRNRSPARFAGGRAKGLNAVGKMDLERHKKRWREEWEEERRREDAAADAAACDEIDEIIDRMRLDHDNHMSPRTRAAFAEYRRLQALDRAEGYRWWADPEHPLYIDHAASPDEDEPPTLPPPGWGETKREVEEDEEANPKWRSIKDESWE